MSEFSDVYIKYFKYVYKYALSLCKNETTAEDLAQETFLKAMKGLKNFKGGCKLEVWLCQIAKNTYFSWLEKEKKHKKYTDEQAAVDDGFEQKIFEREKAFEIHKALHKLEEPYKEVFTLRVFGELSFSQIADLFSKTESWARVTYHRSKIKLKGELL